MAFVSKVRHFNDSPVSMQTQSAYLIYLLFSIKLHNFRQKEKTKLNEMKTGHYTLIFSV